MDNTETTSFSEEVSEETTADDLTWVKDHGGYYDASVGVIEYDNRPVFFLLGLSVIIITIIIIVSVRLIRKKRKNRKSK